MPIMPGLDIISVEECGVVGVEAGVIIASGGEVLCKFLGALADACDKDLHPAIVLARGRDVVAGGVRDEQVIEPWIVRWVHSVIVAGLWGYCNANDPITQSAGSSCYFSHSMTYNAVDDERVF